VPIITIEAQEMAATVVFEMLVTFFTGMDCNISLKSAVFIGTTVRT